MNKITLPEGYRPSEDEEYMNPVQLEYYRLKLLAWKEDLINKSNETIEHLKQERWHESDLNDRASVETEAFMEIRTSERYLKLINKIEGALKRIENKSYGYCEETGEPIGLKRLEARPIATLCIEAQERHEQYENTHGEE